MPSTLRTSESKLRTPNNGLFQQYREIAAPEHQVPSATASSRPVTSSSCEPRTIRHVSGPGRNRRTRRGSGAPAGAGRRTRRQASVGPFLPVSAGRLTPLAPPYPLDPLVAHMPAGFVQQSGHHPIAVTPVGAGHLDDLFRQPLPVRCAAWNLALRRSVLPECAAGAALGYAERLPHMLDALATARRAQKFPRAASARIILSSVRSETARRSRWFSVSSSFNRLR